jgi:hypothetical protein
MGVTEGVTGVTQGVIRYCARCQVTPRHGFGVYCKPCGALNVREWRARKRGEKVAGAAPEPPGDPEAGGRRWGKRKKAPVPPAAPVTALVSVLGGLPPRPDRPFRPVPKPSQAPAPARQKDAEANFRLVKCRVCHQKFGTTAETAWLCEGCR